MYSYLQPVIRSEGKIPQNLLPSMISWEEELPASRWKMTRVYQNSFEDHKYFLSTEYKGEWKSRILENHHLPPDYSFPLQLLTIMPINRPEIWLILNIFQILMFEILAKLWSLRIPSDKQKKEKEKIVEKEVRKDIYLFIIQKILTAAFSHKESSSRPVSFNFFVLSQK